MNETNPNPRCKILDVFTLPFEKMGRIMELSLFGFSVKLFV